MNFPVTRSMLNTSQGTKMRFLPLLTLLFLSACGGDNPLSSLVGGEEHIEIITIGPHIQTCYGAHGERDCMMEYNEDSGRWEFFYEGIQGFEFEPGFIYTLEVRLEDRGTENTGCRAVCLSSC